MKTKTMRPSLKLGLLAPMALAAAMAAPHAQADILLAQTTLVNGTETTKDSFTTSGAGTVTVNLQSIDWPTQLSALSFSATSSDHLLAYWNGGGNITAGSLSFAVAGAGTYYADIMATAATGGLDLGLYAMNLTFTPSVPLPASGWMLLTGMFVLAGLARVMRPFELMGPAKAA